VNIGFVTEQLPYSQICGTKVGSSYKKRRQRDHHEKNQMHFQCEACNLNFSRRIELYNHRKEDAGCTAFICPGCHINFKDGPDKTRLRTQFFGYI